MLDVARAETLIREHLIPLDSLRLRLDLAAGAVLAEDIFADRDQPPMDRVTMDGIAIRHQSWREGQRTFSILGIQAAGMPAVDLDDDQGCFEVMTGACLPTGCDCVIPVERVQRDGGRARLAAEYQPERGQFIHQRGSDYTAGTPLLAAGTLLRSPEIAVLAATGRDAVTVTQRPRISIISTGDELVAPGQPIASHQIRSSNDVAMAAPLTRIGVGPVRTLRIADDRAHLAHDIGRELEQSDILVLSGGVSMGKFDFLPEVFATLHVSQVFHRVRQRPGKPMWFGTGRRGQMVFALPGNPVSALTCLHRYVIPAISEAMAATDLPRPLAILGAAYEFLPHLSCFLPVKIRYDRGGQAVGEPCPTNTSGDFASLTRTDGFIELPAEMQHFPAGWAAPFYPWL